MLFDTFSFLISFFYTLLSLLSYSFEPNILCYADWTWDFSFENSNHLVSWVDESFDSRIEIRGFQSIEPPKYGHHIACQFLIIRPMIKLLFHMKPIFLLSYAIAEMKLGKKRIFQICTLYFYELHRQIWVHENFFVSLPFSILF